MKQTGDLNLVKKINKSIVLHYIRHHAPLSRASIAEQSGLTKATVSSLVNEWIESGFVDEIGTGVSSGGRKPMLLLFHASAGFAIGVDIGVHYIVVVLTDLNGTVLFEKRLEHHNDSLEAVLLQVKTAIRLAMEHAPASQYGVIGIGIGIPGISDGKGTVLFAPNLGWEHVALQQMIEAEFGKPVLIDNEANLGAVGENRYGVSKETDNMIYLSIGTGIGAGIIIKGELYRGAAGFTGELGHMSIQYDGKPCRCGNLGCWELYASEQALIERAAELWPDRRSFIDIEMLVQAADGGDEEAIQLFERLGCYLAVGIVSIVNGFNPERIVIGGNLTLAQRWLSGPIMAWMESHSITYPRARLDVQFSQPTINQTARGASSQVISGFFAAPNVAL